MIDSNDCTIFIYLLTVMFTNSHSNIISISYRSISIVTVYDSSLLKLNKIRLLFMLWWNFCLFLDPGQVKGQNLLP